MLPSDNKMLIKEIDAELIKDHEEAEEAQLKMEQSQIVKNDKSRQVVMSLVTAENNDNGDNVAVDLNHLQKEKEE